MELCSETVKKLRGQFFGSASEKTSAHTCNCATYYHMSTPIHTSLIGIDSSQVHMAYQFNGASWRFPASLHHHILRLLHLPRDIQSKLRLDRSYPHRDNSFPVLITQYL